MSYRVGCWETCIKMQIEIYTSYIVYGLLLGGYGETCIKIQIEIYTSHKEWKVESGNEEKRARHEPHSECLHNGIILIVYILQIVLQR